jgi:hypothetical protein
MARLPRKTNSKAEVSSDQVLVAEISKIKPSPENDAIYGAVDPKDIDLINLANDIAQNGVREPLLVSRDGFIVSGHRRYAAARLVKLRSIPVRRLDTCRSQHDDTEWKRLLRAHNHQRVKSSIVRVKEVMLDIDPDLAHEQLIAERKKRDCDGGPKMEIRGVKTRSEISERKQEFLQAAIRVIRSLERFWPLTVRLVHYRLLNNPPMRNTSIGKQRSRYQNDKKSYFDLCDLLTRARLLGLVAWEAITDETRPTSGLRFDNDIAQFIDRQSYNFLRGYRRNLLQSQSDHIELILEKMTVQGIVEPIARKYCLPMTVGRGYCSIDPRHEIVQRYRMSGKDQLKLLVCSDFDPDGEEIAESFARSIRDDFGVTDVVAIKTMLRQDQVKEWQLPTNFESAKTTSSNYTKFISRFQSEDVYELEAIPPAIIEQSITETIESNIDLDAFNRELALEREDAAQLQAMKSTFAEWFPGMLGNGDFE